MGVPLRALIFLVITVISPWICPKVYSDKRRSHIFLIYSSWQLHIGIIIPTLRRRKPSPRQVSRHPNGILTPSSVLSPLYDVFLLL